MLHYAQNISDKVFGAYDWGEEGENRRRYGSPSPPLYQLARVQTETCLFWSPQDSLSSREDMQRLARELPNILACREVNIKAFISFVLSANRSLAVLTSLICQVNLGHLEYLWGNNFRKQELYSDLISLLQMEGQSKEQNKEHSKEKNKDEIIEKNKEQSKDQSKYQSKEQSKDKSNKTRHLDCGPDLLARTR